MNFPGIDKPHKPHHFLLQVQSLILWSMPLPHKHITLFIKKKNPKPYQNKTRHSILFSLKREADRTTCARCQLCCLQHFWEALRYYGDEYSIRIYINQNYLNLSHCKVSLQPSNDFGGHPSSDFSTMSLSLNSFFLFSPGFYLPDGCIHLVIISH